MFAPGHCRPFSQADIAALKETTSINSLAASACGNHNDWIMNNPSQSWDLADLY